MKKTFLGIGLALPILAAGATLPDWTAGAKVPLTGRTNPYELSSTELAESIRMGKTHTQVYPVEITGLLPPYIPFEAAVNGELKNPLTHLMHSILGDLMHVHNVDEIIAELGLHPYPSEDETGVYVIPHADPRFTPINRVGFGTIQTPDGLGFTISCAACHSSNLFGKTVLGLTNRFPRANETFLLGKKGTHVVTARMIEEFAKATPSEAEMYRRVQAHMPYIGAKKPATLGLDTSLAQVALSLAHRSKDEFAEELPENGAHPRPDLLDQFVADSKPAVWWNVKYKNRWLSDGSVVSGNPIFTNLLWNEIGRGTDLHELDAWLDRNQTTIRDLTEAVFSIEAPRFTDFFPAEHFDLAAAKRGETVFKAHCAGCHGNYDKQWSLPGAEGLPAVDQMKTWQVRYKEQTKVVDVGTDPQRWQGMASLTPLNDLAISKKIGVAIEPQKGYVPPPLVGIWARWPYFHNNSAPSLCAVLTRHEARPQVYSAVEAIDPSRDFDAECNGYPANPQGKVREVYDTSRPGMRNIGHDEKIFLKDGKEILSTQDKSDLIRFLQTL